MTTAIKTLSDLSNELKQNMPHNATWTPDEFAAVIAVRMMEQFTDCNPIAVKNARRGETFEAEAMLNSMARNFLLIGKLLYPRVNANIQKMLRDAGLDM